MIETPHRCIFACTSIRRITVNQSSLNILKLSIVFYLKLNPLKMRYLLKSEIVSLSTIISLTYLITPITIKKLTAIAKLIATITHQLRRVFIFIFFNILILCLRYPLWRYPAIS